MAMALEPSLPPPPSVVVFGADPDVDLNFLSDAPPPPLPLTSDARRFVPAGIGVSRTAACKCGGAADGARAECICCDIPGGPRCGVAQEASDLSLLRRSRFLICASIRFNLSCSARLLSSWGEGPGCTGSGIGAGAE